VLSSIASATAWASPKGTTRKPGVYGPYPSRASGSVDRETIVVVRPWKFPAATMIVGSATPRSCPHLRAALTAVSTASAPVFIGTIMGEVPSRARESAVSAHSASAKGSSRSCMKARDVRQTRSSWAVTAASSAGWR